jgi:hypothetical protein
MPDSRNLFAVGTSIDEKTISIIRLGLTLSRSDALNIATWIVALTDPAGEEFNKLLEEVRKQWLRRMRGLMKESTKETFVTPEQWKARKLKEAVAEEMYKALFKLCAAVDGLTLKFPYLERCKLAAVKVLAKARGEERRVNAR